ncbi:phage baseplate assembly protein V [Streptomyces sp. NBC_01142]|uniref:phage baseplate assembly protein V n=1 Tax=Streptomyces sp. NBC_01142 TaxID=2975865 RepID=UPI002250D596|nr:phage baseplate assembly protein V [Streptomyces sp. NBC_01142]MCX4821039.1 phage baseplate assembly protein V [Streptomyces sp. NBC_01142]
MTEPATEPSYYAPRFDVRISGVTLAADVADQVLSLTVETDLDLAGSFSLVLRNSGNTLLDSALLDPGRTVEIHLGYGNELLPAFLGEIASVEPSFPRDGPPTIRVSGYDKSYRMRRVQPEPTEYPLMNDGLIAARIAVENGLIPVVDPTPGLPAKTPQVESDMAFLKARAEKYFFDVYVEWDRLHFHFPRPRTAAHVLEWGRNLSSFSPRISAAGLAGLQVVRGYNQELAQTIHSTALAADLDVADLAERLGETAMDLLASLVRKGIRKHTLDNPLDAAVLARSLLAELLEGMYEGHGSCIGIPGLSAGAYVEIRGVGKRFGGTYRVRKVTHRLDDSGFTTDFSITQRGHTNLLGLLRKQLVEEPPPNRAERFYGVLVAEVEDNNEVLDVPPTVPLGRVKVSYPGLSKKFTSGWAPCARPMAGKDMGFYALPETGDQVLVAFEHGDLSKPYVLGGLWTVEKGPPATNTDGTNSIRVIKSRAGHSITFDDTLDTGELVIRDMAGSAITLNARDGSITIEAGGNLTIKAKGTISLEAAGGKTKISMDATQVDVT